jgi:hypothetical protein
MNHWFSAQRLGRLSLLAVVWAIAGCGEPTPATISTPKTASAPPPPPPLSSEAKNALMQEDVRRILTATMEADYSTLLDYTHPKLIASMGGREAVMQVFQSTAVAESLRKVKFEEVTFPQSPTFLKGSQNEFVVVPVRLAISVNGKKRASNSYQLGARAVGSQKWGYLEGSRLTRETLTKLFPDFPTDYELPAKATETTK